MYIVTNSFLVTTSKALVTSSDALVPSWSWWSKIEDFQVREGEFSQEYHDNPQPQVFPHSPSTGLVSTVCLRRARTSRDQRPSATRDRPWPSPDHVSCGGYWGVGGGWRQSEVRDSRTKKTSSAEGSRSILHTRCSGHVSVPLANHGEPATGTCTGTWVPVVQAIGVNIDP